MESTLGLYMSFENTIETIGVKVRVDADTELAFSVYLIDAFDDDGNDLKVYGSSIKMNKTTDYTWVSLPINLYLNSNMIRIELVKNVNLSYADETWSNIALAAGC